MFLLIKCDFTFKKKLYHFSFGSQKQTHTVIYKVLTLWLLIIVYCLFWCNYSLCNIMTAIIQKYIKNNSHLWPLIFQFSSHYSLPIIVRNTYMRPTIITIEIIPKFKRKQKKNNYYQIRYLLYILFIYKLKHCHFIFIY